MSFNHLNRRLHLYLGLSLLPWFFVYGLSSVFFSHRGLLNGYYGGGTTEWTTRFERPYAVDAPASGDIRPVGRKVMDDLDIHRPFYISRYGKGGFRLNPVQFLGAPRITYRPDTGTLLWEDRAFRWDQQLVALHARGGFHEGFPLYNLWSVLVDLFCIGVLVWIASGLVMWWQLRAHRKWGALVLGLGAASFVAFLFSF